MPATARSLDIPQEVLDKRGGQGGGAYSAIPVPSDQIATLVDVNDYDKRAAGKSHGWVWKFMVLGAEFEEYTSFTAKWKIDQVITALGGDVSVGINNIDPNLYIGLEAGAHLDWQRDPNTLGENESNFREIKYFFPLADEPEAEAAPEPEVL